MLYLAIHLGYKITSIDFSPRVRELKTLFLGQGFEAEFIEDDFLSWNPDKKFDFAYSRGFVEHFDQYIPVINKHWDIVNPDGIMLIIIPIFTPYQYFVRWIFNEPSK